MPEAVTPEVHLHIVDAWLAPLTPRTHGVYRASLAAFIEWCERESIKLLDATEADVRRHLASLTEAGAQHGTVRHRKFTLAGYYRSAVRLGLIPRSPVQDIKITRQDDKSLAPILPMLEVRTLRDVAATRPVSVQLLLDFAVVHGLSVSTICAIDCRDVHDADNDMHLRITRGSTRISLPVAPITAAIVRLALRGQGTGPLLVRRDGQRVDRRTAYGWLRALSRRAGIGQSAHPRLLQATMIAIALDHGVPLGAIQRWAGYGDLRRLQRFQHTQREPSKPVSHLVADALVTDETPVVLQQAQRLLAERNVHPVAPIVLASAALEEHLRALVESAGATIAGRPGINAYAVGLRTAGALDVTELRRLNLWGDLRNAAAHGRYDDLTFDDAVELVTGVEGFILRYPI